MIFYNYLFSKTTRIFKIIKFKAKFSYVSKIIADEYLNIHLLI